MPKLTIVAANFAPEVSGSSPYTSAMSRVLSDAGWPTEVITTHPFYPEWRIRPGYGAWRSTENIGAAHVTRLRHFVPKKPGSIMRLLSESSFGWRAATSRWPQTDVLLLASPAMFATAVVALRNRRRLPSVVWVQDLYSLGVIETGSARGPIARIVSGIEARVLRSASKVVVIHPRFAAHVIEKLGVAKDRVEVIRNWAPKVELPAVDVAAERRRLGWGDDEIVVLHAGNIGLKQGLDNVVAAARLADAGASKVRFVLMGDGNQRDRLRETAAGIRSIEWIDSQPEDVYQANLAAADILLVNELEGVSGMSVPSKLTSYFTAGRPVVAATDVDGITAGEIAAAGAGVSVPAGDPAALLAAAVAMAADLPKAEAMGRAGAAFSAAELSEEAAALRFQALLRGLVKDA